MKESILNIENLAISYHSNDECKAVNHIDIQLEKGESIGIIGESGSGKSSLALAVMGLLKEKAHIKGNIYFKEKNLLDLSEPEMNQYRWKNMAIVFQNTLNALNPVLRIEEQIIETMMEHINLNRNSAMDKARTLFEMVGLKEHWLKAYPHQMSGGMRQKVLIAMALSCDPELLIVDEPTMALDSVSKMEIVSLLSRLKKEKGFSMIVISHELPVIADLTTRLFVMYKGFVLEEGRTKDMLKLQEHPYTKGLVTSSPAMNPYRDIWGIPGEMGANPVAGCPFYSRCNQRIDSCQKEIPLLKEMHPNRKVACIRGGIVTLLKGQELKKNYEMEHRTIRACGSCSIEVKAGEVVGLIGESGSGKTTLAEMLAGIILPDEGKVMFEDRALLKNKETAKINGIQIVFQDPVSSTNELLSIEEIVREPLDIIGYSQKKDRKNWVKEALKNVQLPYEDAFLKRKGFELSGGQRQRLAIARALIMRPKLLIADEISAMLDPSTGANIIRLLKGLQNEKGFSMLYITHDLALAQKISDRIYVMKDGRIIEEGSAVDVFENPEAPYTKQLIGGIGSIYQKICCESN